MIENKQLRIKRSKQADVRSLPEAVRDLTANRALRWYVGQTTEDEFIVEATLYEKGLPRIERLAAGSWSDKTAVLSVIPTGTGCSIGGFAGDAAPVTNLLAATVDYLITNPNAVNASNFIGLGSDNLVYTDGCCIDLFCQGLVDFYVSRANRVGVIIEKTSQRNLELVFNIINAVRAVHGINITDCIITEEPIGGRCVENDSGGFAGTVDNPQVILDSCEKLLGAGVDAIALTSNIQDLPLDSYAKHFNGEYANPVGGVEAVISYLVTSHFQVPAAHSPMMNIKELDLKNQIVDARGAGEMASTSGLACILMGLAHAPQINPKRSRNAKGIVTLNNLLAIVNPSSCMGGIPSLYAHKHGVPVIAVRDNQTVLDVSESKLGMDGVIEVANYAEAAGVILALKNGLSLETLYRPLRTLRCQ